MILYHQKIPGVIVPSFQHFQLLGASLVAAFFNQERILETGRREGGWIFLSLICFSINHNHSKARPRACTIHIMYKMIQIGLSTEHKKLLYVLYSAFTLVCVPRCVLCQYPTYYRRSSRYANSSYANSTYATFQKVPLKFYLCDFPR